MEALRNRCEYSPLGTLWKSMAYRSGQKCKCRNKGGKERYERDGRRERECVCVTERKEEKVRERKEKASRTYRNRPRVSLKDLADLAGAGCVAHGAVDRPLL